MIKETKTICMVLFILLFFFHGCAPTRKKVVFEPQPQVITAPILPLDVIDKKISSIEELLKNNAIAENDRDIANELLADYQYIKSSLYNPMNDSDQRELIHILFRNLIRFDEKYLIKKTHHEDSPGLHMMKDFYQIRRRIMESYFSGDYQSVIRDCIHMESSFGPDSLTPEIGLLFAESLAKRDMLQEAVRIGEKIIKELEEKPDIMHLEASLIEWQLELGDREKASRLYEKLADSLDEREMTLKNIQKKIFPDRGDGYRVNDMGSQKILEEGVGNIEFDRIEDLLHAVDNLIKGQLFSEAKLLLIKWRLRHEEGPDTELIENALKRVETAEERLKKEQSLERMTVAKAMKFIEEENFEEAISELDYWIDANGIDPEIKKIKELAIEKLINRERNKAAKIFLLAKNASDLKRKKELLISSLNILKNLIEKYPSSNLINKLNNHVNRVREELEKIREPSG